MKLNTANLDVIIASHKKHDTLGTMCIKDGVTVATDSYMLIETQVVPSDGSEIKGIESDNKTCIVPMAAVEKALKNTVSNESLDMLNNWYSSVDDTVEPAKVRLKNTDLEVTNTTEARVKEGNYPDYNAVFPSESPVCTVGVDAEKLEKLMKYFKKHAKGKRVILEIHADERSPLVIKAKTEDKQVCRALLMPLRLSDIGKDSLTQDELTNHDS